MLKHLFSQTKKYKKKKDKGIKLLEEKLYDINYLKEKNEEFSKRKFPIKNFSLSIIIGKHLIESAF